MSASEALPVYPFGTVLQHSRLPDVIYLVLCPTRPPARYGNDYHAVRLSTWGAERPDVITIGQAHASDWNVLEVITDGR